MGEVACSAPLYRAALAAGVDQIPLLFSITQKQPVRLDELLSNGHRVYGGSECSTRKHIENTTFLRHKRTGLLRKSNPPLYRTGADLLIGHTELGNSPNTS